MLHWTLQNDAIINLSTQLCFNAWHYHYSGTSLYVFLHKNKYAYNDRRTVIQKIWSAEKQFKHS